MDTVLVAHADDAIARTALDLVSFNRVLIDTETPSPRHLALFGVESLRKGGFLRVARHRMPDESIAIPAWAAEMPFVVAVNAQRLSDGSGFRQALAQVIDEYRQWAPWMKEPFAPWMPYWHSGNPHKNFAAWQTRANEVIGMPTMRDVLEQRLQPVFAVRSETPVTRLVITGCALFNQPHTDVTDFIPGLKKKRVVEVLGNLIGECQKPLVDFIVPRGDLLQSGLRAHFHPFMFMSLAEAGAHVPEAGRLSARLFGLEHAHRRSDEEIARALERSGDAIVNLIARPLEETSRAAVRPRTWHEYVGAYFPAARALAEECRDVAEAIYMKRVATRPSYASFHKIDPQRGLERTVANNIFYIAEAMYLRDNPDVGVVNCEFEDAFWKGLEPLLEREVWGSFRPLIGMAPRDVRQPWGY